MSANRSKKEPTSETQSVFKRFRWPVLTLIIVTLISFSPVLENTFVNWDDPSYVTNNQQIRDLSLDQLFAWFEPAGMTTYPPLVMISFSLEYWLIELDPRFYHLDNLLLHLLNVLLVFWMIWLLAENKVVAFLTALLFSIHPMHVESVAWITERKDVLFSVFYLGAAVSYLYYCMDFKYKFYGLSLVLFALSLSSKPQAVTLPILLLLLDYQWSARYFHA